MTIFNPLTKNLLVSAAVAASLSMGGGQAGAQEAEPPLQVAAERPQGGNNAMKHHALSLVGKVKFGPDFKHFDWVNPDAPKGGTVRNA